MTDEYTEPLGLTGDPDMMMYRLHFYGGPSDGQLVNGFRPYFKMMIPQPEGPRAVYEAKEKPPDHLIWVDDFTKDIHLHYKGEEDAAADAVHDEDP